MISAKSSKWADNDEPETTFYHSHVSLIATPAALWITARVKPTQIF